MNNVFVNARFLTQPISGVQHFALTVCRSLQKKIPGIVFITCKDILHEELGKELNVIRVGKLSGHAWEQIDLPAYMNRQKHGLLINLCNTAPLWYKNQFNTIHDLAFEKNEPWFNARFKYYYRWLIPKVAKTCIQLFTVSQFSADEISHYYGIQRSQIKILGNSFPEDMEMHLKSQEGSPLTEPYFLTVGSMDPRKNLNTVLKAFVEKKWPGIKMVVIGRKNVIFGQTGFEKNILSHPMIMWIDDIDNMRLVQYYKHAVAYINLSFYEGFGLTNLEAMVCGCPVIVSDIPVFHEVCRDSGYYVSPNEKQALAQAMLQVYQNPDLRKELKTAGLNQSAHYSLSRQIEPLIQAIKEAGYN